jgi:two-component system response regulator AtoC
MTVRPTGKTILVADDDLEVRGYFETILKLQGYDVLLADSGEEALRRLEDGKPEVSLALLDVMMPGKDGIETAKEIQRLYALPIILVSSACSWPFVMDALDGAPVTFIAKPVMHNELRRAIEELFGERARAPMPEARQDSERVSHAQPPRARNPRMREIESLLRQVGVSDVPVLLQGETGVGKEVLARQLHSYSARAGNRFLKLNCAALPPELVESELFGYERGAFTGAFKDRPGKFEAASGGTLLLDEIGDMELRLQAKLLQVLQDNEFQRLGGGKTVRVNVRIMAATHRDLKKLIREKSFREDLYYRLNVISLYVPPLRERKDELPWLAGYFLKKHATAEMPAPPVTLALQQAMLEYHWPGNVREVENMMRKYLVLRQPRIIIEELHLLSCQPDEPSPPAEVADRSSILERVQQSKDREMTEAILVALNTSHWNRKLAATRLNLEYKAFLYRMKKLGIDSKPAASGSPLSEALDSVTPL